MWREFEQNVYDIKMCTYCGAFATYTCVHPKIHTGNHSCEKCLDGPLSPKFLPNGAIGLGNLCCHIGQSNHLISQASFCRICFPIDPLARVVEISNLSEENKKELKKQLQRFYHTKTYVFRNHIFDACVVGNFRNYQQLYKILPSFL